MKTEYVIGFLYGVGKVLLIKKNRPEWQKGLYNGVGGHIEQGELPHDAMVREFEEETGATGIDWNEFCVMDYPDAVVHCFAGLYVGQDIRSTTDELVFWLDPNNLFNTIPNLLWLVPMGKLWFKEEWEMRAVATFGGGGRNA